MKLFLHCCCGPCYLGVNEGLASDGGILHGGDEVLLWYYNPNIHPLEEEALRWEQLAIAADASGRRALRAPYEPERHALAIAPTKGRFGGADGGRCIPCYQLRLDEAALAARAAGFDTLSTTLLVSPWQRHEDIIAMGRRVAAARGLAFLGVDFRIWYRAGQEKAKALGLYRQKYCGCELSKGEAAEQESSRAIAKAARTAARKAALSVQEAEQRQAKMAQM